MYIVNNFTAPRALQRWRFSSIQMWFDKREIRPPPKRRLYVTRPILNLQISPAISSINSADLRMSENFSLNRICGLQYALQRVIWSQSASQRKFPRRTPKQILHRTSIERTRNLCIIDLDVKIHDRSTFYEEAKIVFNCLTITIIITLTTKIQSGILGFP